MTTIIDVPSLAAQSRSFQSSLWPPPLTLQTDQDRTRTELVQRYCFKCLGVTPHTRTYTYSAFAWPEPGVDTCDLCDRSL